MVKIKQAVHNNLTCSFTEKNHQYRIEETGQILISATTLIDRFFPVFDSQAIAEKTGKKRGVSSEELLKEWAGKGEIASLEGNYIHNYLELEFMQAGLGQNLKKNPPTKRAAQMLLSADIVKKKLKKNIFFLRLKNLYFVQIWALPGKLICWYMIKKTT